MLSKFKKQYATLCESVLGYTIRTIDKDPIPVNIDGRDLKILFKVSELIDGNGEIKSIDPVFEMVNLVTTDGVEVEDQNLMIKYGEYIRKCIEDSVKVEKDLSKKEAKKESNKKVVEKPTDQKAEKDGLLVKTAKKD